MASSRLPAQAKVHIHSFLWASKHPSLPFATCKTLQTPKSPKRPLQWLLLGFQRRRKLASMAFSGRPSLPFASPATLQTSKTPLQWLLMGFQRRQTLPQGQIHCCFWAVQRSVRQAFAANGHPKATSMVSSGLPAQAKATPRPDPLLFLGSPASRWPGTRSEQASQGHIHGFLWASKLAVCQPENAPNGFPAQAKATPRRDPLLFLGGPACGSLGIRSQRASQGGIPRPHQWLLMGLQRRQKLPQGQIHCFCSAVQRAIGQAFATNRHQAFKPAVYYFFPSQRRP